MKQPVCAVFDIGREYKKVLVLDESFKCIEEVNAEIPAALDTDGFRCENVSEIKKWILASFDDLRKSKKYDLKAVNFISNAGSMVHLDESGEPVLPIFDVLKSIPYAVETQFKEEVVSKYDLLIQTESPFLGIMNAGVQLYWLKEVYPDKLKKSKDITFFTTVRVFLIDRKTGCREK